MTTPQPHSADEELELWESMFGDMAVANAGHYVITCKEFLDRVKTYRKKHELQAKEIFIPIRGYEGLYEVSNFGNVRSLARGIVLKKSRRGGYQVVTLANGKSRTFTVHRLVAENFLSNPMNKKTVNHKDGIRHNNNVENLEWATYSENVKHSFDVLGKVPHNKGKKFIETHCVRGHEFTNQNTYIRADGGRMCKKCTALRNRKRREELKKELENL